MARYIAGGTSSMGTTQQYERTSSTSSTQLGSLVRQIPTPKERDHHATLMQAGIPTSHQAIHRIHGPPLPTLLTSDALLGPPRLTFMGAPDSAGSSSPLSPGLSVERSMSDDTSTSACVWWCSLGSATFLYI